MNATLANPLLPPLPQTQAPTTVVVQLSAEDRYLEPKIDVLAWVFTILSGTVVGLRIYNKFRRRLQLWWDDYIVIVAWVRTIHRYGSDISIVILTMHRPADSVPHFYHSECI